MDVDLTDIDINQCDPDEKNPVNMLDFFQGTHGCQPTTHVGIMYYLIGTDDVFGLLCGLKSVCVLVSLLLIFDLFVCVCGFLFVFICFSFFVFVFVFVFLIKFIIGENIHLIHFTIENGCC